MKELRKIKINETETIDVCIDPSLDKYDNIVLFPESLAKANEAVKNSNLLEIIEQFEKEHKL